jgi:hypothetical protein
MPQPSCRSTDDPNGPVRAREAPRGYLAKRLATILGTARRPGPAGHRTRQRDLVGVKLLKAGWRGRSCDPISVSNGCSRTSSSATASYPISVFVVRDGDTSAASRGGGSGFTGMF